LAISCGVSLQNVNISRSVVRSQDEFVISRFVLELPQHAPPVTRYEPYGESLCFQAISLSNDPHNYFGRFYFIFKIRLKGLLNSFRLLSSCALEL